MKQHEVVPVINRADDRTLLLSDGRLESAYAFPVLCICFFPFRCSFAFHYGFHRAFLQASPATALGHSTPVFARSFFLAESDPAVLLSCQIFLHAKQIALADTLNNPQQLFHRGDLIQARDRQEVSH